MKQWNLIARRSAAVVLVSTIMLMAMSASARLPKPIQVEGTILAIDPDTQTLVFKQSKDKKPLVLDWNKDTQFILDDKEIGSAELKERMVVTIYFKHVSFRNPLLKKVVWKRTTKEPAK